MCVCARAIHEDLGLPLQQLSIIELTLLFRKLYIIQINIYLLSLCYE